MFRKSFAVECSLCGDAYVGVLPGLSEWFTKCAIVPHRGDTVPLPACVCAVRAPRADVTSLAPQVATLDVMAKTGVVTSVYYLPTRDLVRVTVEELLGADNP